MWADLTLFLTVLARMTGFVVFNPIFGRTGIPGIFKSGLSLLLAVTTYTMTTERPPVPETPLGLLLLLAMELAIGYFLGLVMNIFFYIPMLGGETIDIQMGMSMGRTYDPSSQTTTTVTSRVLNTLMMLLFFAGNGHHTLLRIIMVSGRIVPFGAAAFGQDLYWAIVELFIDCTILGVKLCMPILAAELLGQVGMGILMKVIPQINVFAINIELKVIIGLGLLYLLLNPMSEFLLKVEVNMLQSLPAAAAYDDVAGGVLKRLIKGEQTVAGGGAEEKTEKATPKKRRDERKKGNVLMSRDVVAVATLLGSLIMMKVMAGVVMQRADDLLRTCFDYVSRGYAGILPDIGRELLFKCLVTVVVVGGPFLLVTMVLAVAATFAQTRLLVTTEPLKPKLSKLNPLEGFKRLFSLRSVVEMIKNLIKIGILMYLIFDYFTTVAVSFGRLLDMELNQAGKLLFDDIFNLILRVVIAFAAVAFFDYLYQWWDYERKLRMSKQEIKEEYKQTEGDPQVKGKIKEIQRRRAQQRMMQQVPGADVVIRNPTHVSVALRYKPERDSAPVMVAKGLDELALRIVKVAEENQVAVVENVPLARSLYAEIDLDREITPEFYGPVAEILVYVLKMDQEAK